MIKFKLFVAGYEKDENLPLRLLKDVEKKLGIKTEIKRFTEEEGNRLKFDIMLPISVFKKIGIKQTRRTKTLYTQLLIFEDGNLFTFYPQSYAEKGVSIQSFLEELLKGKVICLHDQEEFKSKMFEQMKQI